MPAAATTIVAEGTYVANGKVAVVDGNKPLRKAGLVNRNVKFKLGRARVSGAAPDGMKRSKVADLVGGDQVVVHASSKSSRRVRPPLPASKVIVKKPPASSLPAGVPAKPRGVSTSLIWGWVPESESARDIREAAALGADTIRVTFRWDSLQVFGPGAIPQAQAEMIDRLMAVAKSQGIRIVAQVMGTPCWASAGPKANGACTGNASSYPPAHADDYGAFVHQIADRWGGQISGYEVWNEPNLASFWSGTPAQYVDLVHAAKTAVTGSSYPAPPVVAGALSESDTTYLQKLYDQHVDRWSDAISIHPYAIRWDIGMVDPLLEALGDVGSFASGVPAVHTLMKANGDSDSIWITEFGYPTCSGQFLCVSQQKQGDYLASALRRAAEWPYVNTFLMYDLRDWSGPGSDINQKFGILNADWSPKAGTAPVKQALADLK
jgi:hypothetical protein